MNTRTFTSVAIVGGGFSGAALAAYLLRFGPADLQIHVIEPRARLGQGIAYGDAASFHILNVPADKMSLWPDQPLSFLHWVKQNGEQLGWPQSATAREQSYLPRQLFGHYVEAQLGDLVRQGRSTLRHHHARVLRLEPKAQGYDCVLDDGAVVRADRVILATGFRPPAIPFRVTGTGPRFIADPWAANALASIGKHDRVVLAGTGLTMVDMVFALDHAKHQGQVIALSRHGYLPRIHDYSEAHPPILHPKDLAKGIVFALSKFRRVLAQGQVDWRLAVDALRPLIDSLWQALPPQDQQRFLRHLRPLWEVHRHRMPAQSAELLLKRISQGRLEVKAAKIRGLTIGHGNVALAVVERGSPEIQTLNAHWVVNCTPPAPPLAPGADDFVRLLVQENLVREHRTGLGFDVDSGGRSLNAQGQVVPNLFVLGPSRRGHSIEATAVPHIRLQLDALMHTLLKS